MGYGISSTSSTIRRTSFLDVANLIVAAPLKKLTSSASSESSKYRFGSLCEPNFPLPQTRSHNVE